MCHQPKSRLKTRTIALGYPLLEITCTTTLHGFTYGSKGSTGGRIYISSPFEDLTVPLTTLCQQCTTLYPSPVPLNTPKTPVNPTHLTHSNLNFAPFFPVFAWPHGHPCSRLYSFPPPPSGPPTSFQLSPPALFNTCYMSLPHPRLHTAHAPKYRHSLLTHDPVQLGFLTGKHLCTSVFTVHTPPILHPLHLSHLFSNLIGPFPEVPYRQSFRLLTVLQNTIHGTFQSPTGQCLYLQNFVPKTAV
jgi:hypothetical protein